MTIKKAIAYGILTMAVLMTFPISIPILLVLWALYTVTND